MSDNYEILHRDEIIHTEPVWNADNTRSTNSILAYAIGYSSHGDDVTVRRVKDGEVIFSFVMTGTVWDPYAEGRPVVGA